MNGEPRTTADIMRDLLRLVVERQWQDREIYLGRGEYAAGCPECQACEELTYGESVRPKADTRPFERDTHRENCPTAALIVETRGFLRVEDPTGDIP